MPELPIYETVRKIPTGRMDRGIWSVKRRSLLRCSWPHPQFATPAKSAIRQLSTEPALQPAHSICMGLQHSLRAWVVRVPYHVAVRTSKRGNDCASRWTCPALSANAHVNEINNTSGMNQGAPSSLESSAAGWPSVSLWRYATKPSISLTVGACQVWGRHEPCVFGHECPLSQAGTDCAPACAISGLDTRITPKIIFWTPLHVVLEDLQASLIQLDRTVKPVNAHMTLLVGCHSGRYCWDHLDFTKMVSNAFA